MTAAFQALGWTLIHFTWQATAVAALYLAADLWLRKAHSQTRYLFTLAALLSMLLLAVVTLSYETARCSAEVFTQVSTVPGSALSPLSFGALAESFALITKYSAHIRLSPVLPWLDFGWLSGVLYCSIRSIGGWWWLQRLRRRTMEKAPEAIHAAFLKVSTQLGISRLPDLRISECISVPMTFGILRSLVLFPASALLALPPDQLEAILAHELAHVRRADYLWNLIQTVAETLFFFHPAIWWIGKRLREQRELCCDDTALEICSDPLVYATALFRLEHQRSTGLKLALAVDGHQSRSDFRARIMRILGEALPQSHKSGLRPLSMLVVCCGLFLFLSPLPKGLAGISSQHAPAKQTLPLSKTRKETKLPTKFPAFQAPDRTSTLAQTTEQKRPNIDERTIKLTEAGVASRPPPARITEQQGSSANEPPPHIGITNLAEASSAGLLPPAKITAEQASNANGPPPHIGTTNLTKSQMRAN